MYEKVSPSLSWRWIILGVVAIVCVIAAISVVPRLRSYLVSRADRREAVYDDLFIKGFPQFVEIVVNNPQEAELYVEMPDKTVYLVKDIPESVLEPLFDKTDMRKDPNFPSKDIFYRCGDVFLDYIDGELILASFHFEREFRFSRHKTGPFVRFPFEYDELIEAFGESLSWKTPGPSGPIRE